MLRPPQRGPCRGEQDKQESPEVLYHIQPDLAFREMEGQLLFLLADDTQLWSVNPTGKLIWREIVRQKPAEAIARGLAKKFHISPQQARSDLDEFLRELHQRRILLDPP